MTTRTRRPRPPSRGLNGRQRSDVARRTPVGVWIRLIVATLVLAAALSTVPQAITAPPAAAAIAQVQTGTKATATTGSITPTLSSASKAGDLLVAVLGNHNTGSSAAFSGPANWINAIGAFRSGTGRVAIWYYPNNPGGITSANFTASSGTNSIIGQLSEWSGADFSSPVDKTGTVSSGSSTTATVSTSAPTTVTGDLAITEYATSVTPITTFTAGTGWTNIFSDGTRGYVADDEQGLATGTVSENETASSATSWAGIIVTFKPGCTSGGLSLTSPTSVTYPSVTLNGIDQTATVTGMLTPNDQTNSNSGWNIAGTSTTFTNGASKTLPTTATRVTAASVAAASNNCSLPTNSIGYPVTLPAGTSAPPAAKLYNAAANTGAGPSNVTLTLPLTVPANTFNGSYTSTWTFTIGSGP